jgi:hypothetical protein
MIPGHKKTLKDYSSRALCFGKRKHTFFFLPDYTVGAGISPVQSPDPKAPGFAGYTAGRELPEIFPAHPALKI